MKSSPLLSKRNRLAHIGIIVCAVFLLVFPLVFQSPYQQYLLTLCMLWAGVATSWNLIAGFAGIFSLGHQALFGFGAYVSAVCATRFGISPWISIFIGAFVAAIIGAIISIPSLKLRLMPYISIATLGMGEILRLVITNSVDLTKGAAGLWGIPPFPKLGSIDFNGVSRVPSYYLMLILLAITLIVTSIIVRAPIGKSFSAIKDSQDAAESLGINVRFNKVLVFMIGSFIAGFFGGFYSHTILLLTPNAVMSGTLGLQIMAYGLVGGLGTVVGPVIGAFAITLGLEGLRFLQDYRMVVYAILIILSVLFMREGVWGMLKKQFLKWSAKRSAKA